MMHVKSKQIKYMISIFIFLFALVGMALGSSDHCRVVKEIWNVIFKKELVNSTESCCTSAPLVSCVNGNVTAIDWTGQHLRGPIPSLFGQLVSLRSLILSANHLSGEIPSELAGLKDLQILDLGYNQITGFGPSLGSLKALTGVNLAYNRVSDYIPNDLGNISSLKGLYVKTSNV
jgi:hypothetical protein